MVLKLIEYNSTLHRKNWNDFILSSKNATFLLNRNFMDYHSDRFQDNSLMFFDDKKIIAVLPANTKNNKLYSHQGLTYGGLIIGREAKASEVLEIFKLIIEYCKNRTFSEFYYKAIPYIYHNYPSQEDLYALFVNNFKLYRRDLSSTIFLNDRIDFSKGRKSSISKAKKHMIQIRKIDKYYEFMELLTLVLKKHNVKPAHSSSEIELLSKLFPNNIKLFGAFIDNNLVSGTLIFENNKTVHIQYIASSEEGKNFGALELIIDYLVNDFYVDYDFLDFGISNNISNNSINIGLLSQKEMFGSRAICYDHYFLEF